MWHFCKQSIAFILIILGAYVFDTRIKTVVVHDNTYYTDNEILERVDLIDYPNFFLLNTSKIEKTLEEDPFIKEVNVKRDLKLYVHIYIKEDITEEIKNKSN